MYFNLNFIVNFIIFVHYICFCYLVKQPLFNEPRSVDDDVDVDEDRVVSASLLGFIDTEYDDVALEGCCSLASLVRVQEDHPCWSWATMSSLLQVNFYSWSFCTVLYFFFFNAKLFFLLILFFFLGLGQGCQCARELFDGH